MTSVGPDGLRAMLQGAADAVLAEAETLTKLDSVIGDGDHGLAMTRAMHALEQTIQSSTHSTMRDALFQASWQIMGIDGGSTGPLLGAFFLGMSNGVGEAESLDRDGLTAMIEAGANSLTDHTKARIGDKTMMDALLPAVEALKTSAPNQDIKTALAAAAEAAEAGAENTADMTARFGRARNLGERSVGHVDPGAKSMALIFRGFANGLAAVDA